MMDPLSVDWSSIRALGFPFAIAVLLAATASYILLVAVYRLTLHPLAKYPGRTVEKISSWPLVVSCIKGNRHIRQYLAHEKYGAIVRDGPNSLCFRTSSALKAIYGTAAHVKKGDWYLTLDISAGAPSVQMVIDQHEHAIRRRVMSPAFSERALRDAEGLIAANVRKFCDRIGKLPSGAHRGSWTEPMNLREWTVYFGYDFISDLAFGRSFELLDHEDNRYVPNVLKSASVFLYYVGYLPFAALVRPLMGTSIQDYFPGKSARDSLKYTRLANSRLGERIARERERKQSEPSRKDIFHYLLNSKDAKSGRGFTTEELQADTSLLIAAGSDGVALAVSALVFYLLQHPDALAKLSDEIRSSFAEATDIRYPLLGKLPYLHACVEESLRLCPPKPGSLPRIVLPGGTNIDGHHIPAGTTVGVSHYVIHRNPEYFPEPNSFVPERWIVGPGVSEEHVTAAKQALCPFGIGPMNCIGKNIAYLAIKLAVAYLVFHYDVRQHGELVGGGAPGLEEGRRDATEYQLWDWIIGFPDGPVVQLRARN